MNDVNLDDIKILDNFDVEERSSTVDEESDDEKSLDDLDAVRVECMSAIKRMLQKLDEKYKSKNPSDIF